MRKYSLLVLLVALVSASCSTSPPGMRLTDLNNDDSSGNGPSTTAGAGGGSSSASTTAGVGGGVPASQCLADTNCVKDADCPSGSHCNTELSPPECQELYCGTSGTICEDVNDCEPGLKCMQQVCVPEDTCFVTGFCVESSDCCTHQCYGNTCQCDGCYNALYSGGVIDPANACMNAVALYDALKQCMCGTCAADCGEQCNGALGFDPYCQYCVEQSCSEPYVPCFENRTN